MDRVLLDELYAHFTDHRQMALLSGPRQVGKTTLALELCRRVTSDGEPGIYLN